MTVKEDLLAIERGFWTGDAEYCRQNLNDVCITAISEMAGAFSESCED